ncbi:UNVERIFIED_CONTAM: hypothetical protein Sradi_5715900 [Sesamum radiatum]|uniref:Retrotransposon gag domain-containing protein n=1 Tax=Sesamum radiatum TaxID=300843 RepID=A0AAW2L5L4_SESRA
MSLEEEHGSQASPPIAPPREEGEMGIALLGGGGEKKKPLAKEGKTFPELGKNPSVKGIHIPNLTEYDGTGDPEDHLEKFLAKANLLDMNDARYYKIFRTTLSRKAMAWFNQLLVHTIENFKQLSQRFLHHFSINKRYPKTASYFFTIIQQEQESLRDYVQQFSEAVLEVPHLNHELLASILQQGLRRGRFRESIARKPPTTLDELLKRAAKYIRIEEALKPKVDSGNKRKIREGEIKDPQRKGWQRDRGICRKMGSQNTRPLKHQERKY